MNEESLFAAALEKLSGPERQAFLDQVCAGDAVLRQRLEMLLAADERSRGILEHGPEAMSATIALPGLAPERLFAGRFKLREKLGEGGMGEVWVADQTEPVQRRVALKVVRSGLDSERMLVRFEQERQALALMDHPNIAKVLDAGIADGRPYFVMELIKGVPITQYCDEARLSPRERLELFLPVCHGVQHAHQKGIIHRDLKPSNILVALYDGKPVPKVIDFGVAKATGPRLTEKSVYTEVGTLIGTLEYMSPEQAELNNLDVDTRSDIYTLGVILYELLTGDLPFSRRELQTAAFTEMLRMIKDVEPPKPSTRLSGSGTLPSVAAVRHMEPKKLIALVRGELDWIVIKCLEKNRGRRYETTNGLARDIERYLTNEPVVAGPPSAGYRLRKFVRRNSRAVLAAVVILLLLVGGIAGTTAGLLAARAQRDQAEENLRLANTNFQLARKAVDECYGVATKEPLLQEEHMRPVRKLLLGKALPFYEGFQAQRKDDPGIEAELGTSYQRVASITAEIGRKTTALEAFEQARKLRETLVAAQPDVIPYQSDLAETYVTLGYVQVNTGQRDAATQSFDRGRLLLERILATHPDMPECQKLLAKSYNGLGFLQHTAGQTTAATRSLDQSRLIHARLVATHPDVAEYQSLLAQSYLALGILQSDTGPTAAAATSLNQARTIQEKLTAAHPEVTLYRHSLARTYTALGILQSDTGQQAAAAQSYKQARQLQERIVAGHPEVIRYQCDLAQNLVHTGLLQSDTGQTAAALKTYDQGLAILVPLARKHPGDVEIGERLADLRSNRAGILAYLGQHDQAAAEAAQVAQEKALTGQNLYNLACAFSVASAAAREDKKLPMAERLRLSEQYATRAVELLTRARTVGFLRLRANIKNMQKDKDIDPLRSRADYKRLLADIEASSPGAR